MLDSYQMEEMSYDGATMSHYTNHILIPYPPPSTNVMQVV